MDFNHDLNQEWDKTFPRSERIDHQKVLFKNLYGLALAGDLYVPKQRGYNSMAAIAICGPVGAVKEQACGLYAQTLAEMGYVTLAFDASCTGESDTLKHRADSPDIYFEDFSAAVDALASYPLVDRNRIGIIGISGFACIALNMAAIDNRIKAIATISLYDFSQQSPTETGGNPDNKQGSQTLEEKCPQQSVNEYGVYPEPWGEILHLEMTNDIVSLKQKFYHYYRTPRGFHSRSPNSNESWNHSLPILFKKMSVVIPIQELFPRPVLLVAGEKSHTRTLSDNAHKDSSENSEIIVIKNADHIDLYDRKQSIPFNEISDFFDKHIHMSQQLEHADLAFECDALLALDRRLTVEESRQMVFRSLCVSRRHAALIRTIQIFADSVDLAMNSRNRDTVVSRRELAEDKYQRILDYQDIMSAQLFEEIVKVYCCLTGKREQ